MKYIFLLFILLGCNKISQDSLEQGRLKIFKKPSILPWGLTPNFIPENSVPIFSIETESRESFFQIHHDWDLKKMTEFFETVIKKEDLHLLQKEQKEDSVVFLAENQTKRVYSIIIRRMGNITDVKLYYRRNTSF
ncbi:MAG: hypothetical protein SFU98_03750 [Leptospiraceae bacterium]|nr:hypothetical protein [Leptospiraceae bacterium]